MSIHTLLTVENRRNCCHPARCAALVVVLCLRPAPLWPLSQCLPSVRREFARDGSGRAGSFLDESRPASLAAAVRARVLGDLPKQGEVQHLDEQRTAEAGGARTGPGGCAARVQCTPSRSSTCRTPSLAFTSARSSSFPGQRSEAMSADGAAGSCCGTSADEYVQQRISAVRAEDWRSRRKDHILVCAILAASAVTFRAIGQEARSLPARSSKNC